MNRYLKLMMTLCMLGLLWLTTQTLEAVTPAYAQNYCSDPNIVCKSGSIRADETWTADKVYVITDSVTFSFGATLTIEPGTIVKFVKDSSLRTLEMLNANGTATNKIIFTALEDDTVGGDTNGDGATTTTVKSDQPQLSVREHSISHIEVRYIGLTVSGIIDQVAISESVLRNNSTGLTLSGIFDKVTISDVSFEGNDIGITGVRNATFSDVSFEGNDIGIAGASNATISNAIIQRNGIGIVAGRVITVTNATLQDNETAIDVDGIKTVRVFDSQLQNNTTAINVDGINDVAIYDTTLQNNTTAIDVGGINDVSIYDTTLQNNDVAINNSRGINDFTISASILQNNRVGLIADSSDMVIVKDCSQILNNTELALQASTFRSINAPLTWWGSPDGPNVTDENGGNYVSGNVTYAPWATSPDCGPPNTGDKTISGQVIDYDDNPIPGVTLQTGEGQTATTDSDGRYTLTGLSAGEYTVTPRLSGYYFAPPARTVSAAADPSNINFVGSADSRLEITPEDLRFFTTVGNNTLSQTLSIRNTAPISLSWQAQENLPWLTLGQTNGSTPGVIETQVDTSSLQAGRYTGQISVTSANAINSPLMVDVSLNIGCTGRQDVDVMLVLDISGSMKGQPLVDAKEAALAFLDQVDLSQNQVGVVSFDDQATLTAELSTNEAASRSAINSLAVDGDTDIAEAVQVALAELQSTRADNTHQPIIILLSDGKQTVSGNPVAEAQIAKAAGVQIITIGLGRARTTTLRTMASSSSDFYYTPNSDELEAIYEQISVTVGCSTLTVAPDKLEYTYTLGETAPSQTLQLGSNGSVLNWTATEVPPWLTLDAMSGQTPRAITAQLEPATLAVGHYDGEITFTSPDATNSPVKIEVGLDVSCAQRSNVDVALVIDVSGSMAGGALDEAKVAAKTFIDTMDLTSDQVSLISFSGSANVVQQLTQDASGIKTKIDSLAIGPWTNISDAIQKARGELNSSRRNSTHQPVIVLLADGLPNRGGSPISFANAAKAEGIYIFTVGLRGDYGLDEDLMRAIASTPADYYETPNASELAEIYSGIAAQVGCPNLAVNPLALTLEADTNNPTASASLTIENQQGTSINWTGSTGAPWLTLNQATGTTPATIEVEANGQTLSPGTYTSTLTITSPGAINSPRTVAVTFDYREGSGRGTITGLVTNGTDPLPHILVWAYRQQGSQWIAEGIRLTDNEGRYSFTAPSGDYRLHYIDWRGNYVSQYYDGVSAFDQATIVNVAANATRDNINVVLEAVQPDLSTQGCGQLQSDLNTGNPLITFTPGCQGPTDIVANRIICDDGSVPSAVNLRIDSNLYPMTRASGNQYRVTLDLSTVLSGRSATYAIELTCGSSTETPISGRVQRYDPSGIVTDRESGQPVVGAVVNLYRVPQAVPDTSGQTHDCRTIDTRPTIDDGVFGQWSGLSSYPLDDTHWVNPNQSFVNGVSEISPTVNPFYTDKDGRYGWDVVEGCWYISVSAEGYESIISPLVGVPPAVADLNIQLKPTDNLSKPHKTYLPIIMPLFFDVPEGLANK